MSPLWSMVQINPLFNSNFLLQVFRRQCWSSSEPAPTQGTMNPPQRAALRAGKLSKAYRKCSAGESWGGKGKNCLLRQLLTKHPVAVIPTASWVRDLVVVNAAGKAQLQPV